MLFLHDHRIPHGRELAQIRRFLRDHDISSCYYLPLLLSCSFSPTWFATCMITTRWTHESASRSMRKALAYQTPNVHVAEDIRLYDKHYLITLRAAAHVGIACSMAI